MGETEYRAPAGLPKGLDERQLRFERAVASILLLSGYVWGRDLVIAVVAVAVTTTMVTAWAVRPLGLAYELVIQPRMRKRKTHMPIGVVRTDDLLLSASLLVATGALFIGLVSIARFLALIIAGAMAMEAAAGVWISGPLWHHLRSRR